MLGIALRTVQHGRGPARWHDEAALVVNVLQKGFLQVTGPLKYVQAAPPLFLWGEKVVAQVLGDGTYALRLLPYLAGCVTVVLAWFAARRALDPQAGVWAVQLVACSDRLLWHSCEAKPYALDAMVSLGILSL